MPKAVNSISIPAPEQQSGTITILSSTRVITLSIKEIDQAGTSNCGSVVIWPELFQRVANIYRQAYADLSMPAPHDDDLIGSIVSSFNALIRQLEGQLNSLEAGSLLPWLEMRIRSQLSSGVTTAGMPKPVSIRDTVIAEQAMAGFTTNELSQAFNLKHETIERIVRRLSAE